MTFSQDVQAAQGAALDALYAQSLADAIDAATTALTQQASALADQNTALTSTNTCLKTQVDTLNAQVADLSGQDADLSAANADLTARVGTLTAANDSLSAQSAALSAQVQTLTVRANTLTGQVDTLTGANTALNAANATLAAQVSALTVRNDGLVAQVGTLNTQVSALTAQRDQALADLAAYKSSHPDNTTTQPPAPAPVPKALVGMSAPKAEWDARLAEVGLVQARRVFLTDFTDPDVALVKSEAAAGRTVVLSYKTGSSTWAQVANGARDADIKASLATMAGYNVPVYVGVHHEPIADSTTLAGDKGSPADFVAMQQHILSLVPAGSKIKFGVIMNGYVWSSGNQGLTDAQIAQYVPKALFDKIAWLSADTYETDNETIVVRQKNMLAWADRVGYTGRLGITEFGCLSAQHLTDACTYVQSTGRFDFLLCFNSNNNNRDGRSWQLTGDLLTAFRSAVTFAKS